MEGQEEVKSTAPESMKFRRLQRRLGTSKCQTVGMLELLWIATAKNCPEGDIGRFSDEEIAIECDYDESPSDLVSALVECGWLDLHSERRLVVHDWADHCPKHVANNLRRWGKSFAIPPKETPKDPPSKPNQTKPNQTNSNPASPNQAKPQVPAGGLADDGTFDFGFERLRPEIASAASKLDKAIYHAGIQGIEPTFIWESANIGEAIKPGLISEIATKIRAREIKKPRPYIEKALRTECESLGLNPSLVRTKVPPYEKLAHA